jgi:type IV fimbrial biogenesis protein FimT
MVITQQQRGSKTMHNQLESSTGYTLMELMVTISIAGILLGVAIPSFTSIISSNRLTTYANELVTALNLARSEAIKRGQHVVVRKTETNWEDGWQVFVDIDRSPSSHQNVFNTGTDIVLRVYSKLPDSYTLRGNNNFINFIRYQPDGTSNNIGSFVLCDNSDGNNIPEKNTSKLITVNATGRLHMGIDADNDGIPEKDDGTEITSCTVSPF